MSYVRKGPPTDSWKPRHAAGVPRAVQMQFDELGERLSRPEFTNGIWVSDGTAPSTDPVTGDPSIPELTHIPSETLARLASLDISMLPQGIVAQNSSTASHAIATATAVVSVAATLEVGRWYKISGSTWDVVQLDATDLWTARIRNGSTNTTLTAEAHRSTEWGSTPWALVQGNGEHHFYNLTIQLETDGGSGALAKGHTTAPHRILIEDIGAV